VPGKREEKQSFHMPMAFISIVAIVAIVGILVMFKSPSGSLNFQVRSASTLPLSSSENIAGRAYYATGNSSACNYSACFIDVPENSPYHGGVLFMAERGYMVGYGNGYFGVADNIARGQVAVVFARMFNWSFSGVPANATFADVPPTHPFYNQIEVMYQKGVTAGCATNPRRYCPDDAVTRWQFAIFMTRAVNISTFNAPATQYFTDVNSGDFYFPFIQGMAYRGIMKSCNQYNQFCPYQAVKRGDAAIEFKELYTWQLMNSTAYY
jgi:hypothetical protein